MAFKDKKGRCHLENGKYAKQSRCGGGKKGGKSGGKGKSSFNRCVGKTLKGTHPGTRSKARAAFKRAAQSCSK